jgi:hypothetical protein
MKTWKCWSMHSQGSRYNVYAREEPDGDTLTIAENVSGVEASDLVRGFTIPDDPKPDLGDCIDECPGCGEPVFHG